MPAWMTPELWPVWCAASVRLLLQHRHAAARALAAAGAARWTGRRCRRRSPGSRRSSRSSKSSTPGGRAGQVEASVAQRTAAVNGSRPTAGRSRRPRQLPGRRAARSTPRRGPRPGTSRPDPPTGTPWVSAVAVTTTGAAWRRRCSPWRTAPGRRRPAPGRPVRSSGPRWPPRRAPRRRSAPPSPEQDDRDGDRRAGRGPSRQYPRHAATMSSAGQDHHAAGVRGVLGPAGERDLEGDDDDRVEDERGGDDDVGAAVWSVTHSGSAHLGQRELHAEQARQGREEAGSAGRGTASGPATTATPSAGCVPRRVHAGRQPRGTGTRRRRRSARPPPSSPGRPVRCRATRVTPARAEPSAIPMLVTVRSTARAPTRAPASKARAMMAERAECSARAGARGDAGEHQGDTERGGRGVGDDGGPLASMRHQAQGARAEPGRRGVRRGARSPRPPRWRRRG